MDDAQARAASQRAVTLACDPGSDSDHGLGSDHEMFCYCDKCIARKRGHHGCALVGDERDYDNASLRGADL